mmetsp:Transcript_28547/g.51684  ORF Transcript_28547/g.51684 Transcript_28547/m.51684 type:complete len:221 (+) Transcript_28547:485-1147(+)
MVPMLSLDKASTEALCCWSNIPCGAASSASAWYCPWTSWRAKPMRDRSKSKATACLRRNTSPKTQRSASPSSAPSSNWRFLCEPRRLVESSRRRSCSFLLHSGAENCFLLPSLSMSQLFFSVTEPLAARVISVMQRSPLPRYSFISSFIAMPAPAAVFPRFFISAAMRSGPCFPLSSSLTSSLVSSIAFCTLLRTEFKEAASLEERRDVGEDPFSSLPGV